MMSLTNVNTQERFREIFDQAPTGMAYTSLDGEWLEVNQRLCEMTGYSREELLARSWQEITHPDDLPRNLDVLAKVASGDLENQSFEKRYIRKDGRTIWIRMSVALMREAAREGPPYFITVIDDITEFKRAQELQQKAEEKCSKAFRQTPMAIVLFSLRDLRYLEVNDAFEPFTGYSRQEALGRTAGELNIFVDPEAQKEIIDALVAGESNRGWETLFRRKDGTIRSALLSADQIEIDGEPCLIGAALDITDRKRLETELQELSGQLIKAQDEERRRIATELTESLAQSVTAVSFEASQLLRGADGELARGLRSLSARIRDIAAGIGIMSQSLHPSGLDYTGLPWAIEGLCRQFTHAHGLQIAFKHEGVPSSLAPDVALCLYRIVQEGLSNVVRHSGRQQAWIELACENKNIRLDIWDEGVGFDAAAATTGLGLLTMRERCRRLNGSLAIQNKKGTRIEVAIPLADAEASLFSLPLFTAPEEP